MLVVLGNTDSGSETVAMNVGFTDIVGTVPLNTYWLSLVLNRARSIALAIA